MRDEYRRHTIADLGLNEIKPGPLVLAVVGATALVSIGFAMVGVRLISWFALLFGAALKLASKSGRS